LPSPAAETRSIIRAAMRRPILAVAVLTVSASLLLIVGCEDIAKNLGYVPEKAKTPVPKEAPKSKHPAATHRFVLGRFEGGVAFDTQTGQICRT
jgi:hypothetical protein